MSAEDAGTISAQIRLELNQMERDGLQAQKMMDSYAAKFKEKGEKGGKMYVNGFGHAQLALNQKLNNMVSSLQAVSPKMGALGDRLASVFSKPIFSMVPAVSAAFQAMLPIIGTIVVAIAALIKGISSVTQKQKEFNNNIKLAKEAQEALSKSARANTEISEKQNEMEERKAIVLAKVRLAFHNMFEPIRKMGAAIKELTDKVFVFLLEKLEAITKGLGIFMSAIGVVIPGAAAAGVALLSFSENLKKVNDEEARAAVTAQVLKEVNAELVKSSNSYLRELKNIEVAERTGAKTTLDAYSAKASAADSYLQILIEQRNEAVRLLKLTEEEAANNPKVKMIEDNIAAMVRQRDEYAKLAEAEKKSGGVSVQEKITEARLAAIEKYEQAEQRARDAEKAGLIDEEEMNKQINAAIAQKYSDMESIVAQYKLTTGETIRLRDETAELVKFNQDNLKAIEDQKIALENQRIITDILIDQSDTLEGQEIERQKAIANLAKTETEKNAALEEAVRLENELILKQRQRAREALQQSDAFIAASDEEREVILENFDKITDGMMKVRENMLKENMSKGSFLENVFGSDSYGKMLQTGSAALGVFNEISDSALEITRQHAERQMAIIDEALKNILKSIENARKAELIAAGFAVDNCVESLEQQLEAAKKTGDEVLIYTIERRKLEQEINDKYDEQAREAEEEAAREKALLEYQLSLQEHKNRVINAINAGIMAVLQALASAPPPYNIVLAGISGAAATVQVTHLVSNPPSPPKFENSGIVPGNSYSGDRVGVLANSGELILNRAHQDNIAGQLTTGATVNAVIIVELNGKDIAQSTVNLINDGKYRIKARAIDK